MEKKNHWINFIFKRAGNKAVEDAVSNAKKKVKATITEKLSQNDQQASSQMSEEIIPCSTHKIEESKIVEIAPPPVVASPKVTAPTVEQKQSILDDFKVENPAMEVDRAKWDVIHAHNPEVTGELKLMNLRMKDPVAFDSLVEKWEKPTRKEKDILAEVAKKHDVEAPRKIPVPFTREFYSAMKDSGYSKFDPAKLAKIYNRLEDIATCDYVEPRDALAASKIILQYNDMDVGQLQKQNKDMKDEMAMSEVKSMVSNLKKEFTKVKENVIEVANEAIAG